MAVAMGISPSYHVGLRLPTEELQSLPVTGNRNTAKN